MKINLKNPASWVLLIRIIIGLSCGLFIRFFSKTNHIILFGHQLNGNLQPLADLLLTQKASFSFHTTDVSIKDLIKISCAKIIITDHGPQILIPLLYLTKIHFIDVWHGLPFKGFDKKDFYWIRHYQQVWVTSELMKTIYHSKFGVKHDKIKITGYARTDKLINTSLSKTRWQQQFDLPNTDIKNVLIAMTWHHQSTVKPRLNFYSNETCNLLNDWGQQHHVRFIIRTHINQQMDTPPTTPWLIFQSAIDYPDTEALLIHTDLLVSDWSSIVFDFIVLKKPMIFIDNPPPFSKGFTLDPNYRTGPVVDNINDFTHTLNALLFTDQWQNYQQNNQQIIQQLYDHTLDGKVASRYYTLIDHLLTRAAT